MLKLEGVVVGVKQYTMKREGKSDVIKYTYHVGDPAGGDPIEVGSFKDGRKFGDKIAMEVFLSFGKNGKVYLNELVLK